MQAGSSGGSSSTALSQSVNGLQPQPPEAAHAFPIPARSARPPAAPYVACTGTWACALRATPTARACVRACTWPQLVSSLMLPVVRRLQGFSSDQEIVALIGLALNNLQGVSGRSA